MYSHYRVAAITPLHYGKDFIADAINSVADIVDEYHIMYSATPCHGITHVQVANPDDRDALYRAVIASGQGHNCYWHEDMTYKNEGHQVEVGAARADSCAIYIKLDADELYPPHYLAAALQYGLDNQRHELRLKMRHYWRSLTRAICHDPAAPGRVYFKMFPDGGEDTFSHKADNTMRVHHMGYALSSDVVRYKMSIHGHQPQFARPWQDWFNDVFMRNRQTDVHPIGSDSWNVEPVELLNQLKNHPFANLKVIP